MLTLIVIFFTIHFEVLDATHEDCGPPEEPASGEEEQLDLCPRWDLPTCSRAESLEPVRTVYVGDDAMFTVSHAKVRADSLAAMGNLTLDALALTTENSKVNGSSAAAAAAWEAALAGSLLAEVSLPHAMCGGGWDMIVQPVMYLADVAAFTHSALAAPPPPAASPPPPCACACTSGCGIQESAQLAAAMGALGYSV